MLFRARASSYISLLLISILCLQQYSGSITTVHGCIQAWSNEGLRKPHDRPSANVEWVSVKLSIAVQLSVYISSVISHCNNRFLILGVFFLFYSALAKLTCKCQDFFYFTLLLSSQNWRRYENWKPKNDSKI